MTTRYEIGGQINLAIVLFCDIDCILSFSAFQQTAGNGERDSIDEVDDFVRLRFL